MEFGTPFSQGDYSYGTNGKVILRVARLPEVPERASAPAAVDREIFQTMSHDGNFFPCPPVPETNESQPFQQQKVKLGCVTVDAKYLRLIKDLPGLKVAVGKAENRHHFPAVTFVFDGGEGRIMPLRDYESGRID